MLQYKRDNRTGIELLRQIFIMLIQNIEPRILSYYKFVVCQDMIYTCSLKNIMELPRMRFVVLNSSNAQVVKEKKRGLPAQVALQSLCGQKSKTTRSGKSIAGFQLRENSLLGCTVNLRGNNMYSFLDQFICINCSSFRETVFWNSLVFEKNDAVHHSMMQMQRRNEIMDYSFGGASFIPFPGLETHFLGLSSAGGWNCTLCAFSANRKYLYQQKEFQHLLTALQFPIQKG